MKSKSYVLGLVAALAVGAAAPCKAQEETTSSTARKMSKVLEDGYIFNIIDWDGGELPRFYERSDQLPLTLEGVRKLSANKFSTEAIVRMIRERRCACDASVEALIGLKEAGASEEVIQAVSLHALPPNRAVNLTIIMDFEGLGGAPVSNQARKGYLYLVIPDGHRERVFAGNLQAILGGKWQRDSLVDQTDLLLPKKVRRIAFSATVPLKTYGRKKAMVFTSTRPNIFTSADIPTADRAGVREYEFDYPTSSLQRDCTLQVLHKQDAMVQDRWHLVRTYFECEWD